MAVPFSLITRDSLGNNVPCLVQYDRVSILTSFSRMMSSLCSVALETVEPDTLTDSRMAVGVSTPVLPTWRTISKTLVSTCSGGNLYARLALGECPVEPSLRASSRSSN